MMKLYKANLILAMIVIPLYLVAVVLSILTGHYFLTVYLGTLSILLILDGYADFKQYKAQKDRSDKQ